MSTREISARWMYMCVVWREKVEANPSEPKYVHTKWGVGYYYHSDKQR